MRTAEIFNGNALIKVTEGSKFSLNGVWTWDVGTKITFGVKQGINVVAIVISKDGSGSHLEVISIEPTDEIANMEVEAEDVEVETIIEEDKFSDNSEQCVEDKILTTEFDKNLEEDVHILILKKNKFTKREIVAFIESNNINIDTSLTKAELVKILDEMNLVKFE